MSTQTLKINQTAMTRDLVIKKGLINCNTNIIPIKTSSFIERIELDDYEEVELWPYHHLIVKLMYLAYNTRLYIAFVVK